MLVWEGELSSTEGEIFALAPSIWEWDGGGDSFDEWVSWANEAIKKIGTFVTPFLGGTATAIFGGIELGLGLAVSLSEHGILGQARNRPIGMITKEGKSYKFDQPILAFNYQTAERLLKTNPTGRGNGILPFTFKDHEDLGGVPMCCTCSSRR